MKIRILLLLLAGLSLALPALAQDNPPKPQTPPPQTQPSDQTQPAQPAADQTQTSASQSQDDQADTKDVKGKHDGSKKDVDAIGNRKVGGMDWYSIETDI